MVAALTPHPRSAGASAPRDAMQGDSNCGLAAGGGSPSDARQDQVADQDYDVADFAV